MSEEVKCDTCGNVGHRKRGAAAPEDWLYIEAKDESDDGSIFIVWACSNDCAEAAWDPGPGVLELETKEASTKIERDRLLPLAQLITHAGLALESPCSACNGGPDPREPDVICAWCGGVGARLIRPARSHEV